MRKYEEFLPFLQPSLLSIQKIKKFQNQINLKENYGNTWKILHDSFLHHLDYQIMKIQKFSINLKCGK